MVVGNELLILGGVAIAVGGWFLAHRHGQLRGIVAASTGAQNNAPPSSVATPSVATPVSPQVAKMLRLLRALRRGDGNGDDPDLLNRLLRSIGADRDKMASDFLRDELGSDSTQRADAAIRKLPIKATTIQSSKGLADDYVFITHFDDLYFIKDKDKANVTDHDVCSFLVALTRARKRVCLISSDPRATPTFLNWISPGRIEDLTVPTDQPEPEPPQ